jgi:hypothetical protein
VSYIQGYDHQTLREIVDPRACRERLEEIDGQRSLPALLERVWLLKVTDQLDEAREVAEVAVRTARMAGTRRDLLRARILHATVQQFRGRLAAADQELTLCAEEAEGLGLARIAAFAYQHRAKVRLELGELDGARADVKATLFLRREAGASEEELTSTLLAIDLLDRMRAGAAASIAG